MKDQTLSVTRVRIQNDTTYEFASQKKIRDISKKEYSTNWIQRIGVAGTAMMGKKQFFGLNLSTEANIKSESTVWNSRIGFLFRFKDSETENLKLTLNCFLL